MKHIRIFENYDQEYLNVGDYVELLKDSTESIFHYVKKGDKCIILEAEDYDYFFPYRIKKIGDDDDNSFWVKLKDVRKLSDLEISEIKYNL